MPSIIITLAEFSILLSMKLNAVKPSLYQKKERKKKRVLENPFKVHEKPPVWISMEKYMQYWFCHRFKVWENLYRDFQEQIHIKSVKVRLWSQNQTPSFFKPANNFEKQNRASIGSIAANGRCKLWISLWMFQETLCSSTLDTLDSGK